MRELHIYSSQDTSIQAYIPDQVQAHLHSTSKSIQKVLRSALLKELVIHISKPDDQDALHDLIRFIRQGVNDQNIWLRVLLDESLKEQHETFYQNSGINDVIVITSANQESTRTTLYNLIEHLDRVQERLEEKEYQTQLLSSINRFSQYRKSLKDMIEHCAETLTHFCSGYTSIVTYPSKIVPVKNIHHELPLETIQGLPSEEHKSLINTAIGCKAPKIELLPESLSKQPLIASMETSIGSYITFPIVMYNKTVAAIVCFIAEEDLDKMTTTKVNVMRDAASQLQLILERRQAESRLSSQYQRLKEMLAELETTKEQLVHSEKMASVGKMAAGIAHEINNPLAFVIGNFGSLEDYVSSLVHMLDLHDELVSSIDKSMESAPADLTEKISTTREEEDIDFIVGDLKSIVNDSRDGLLRVRDIINDLSSFSRQEKIETKPIDLAEMLDEAIRMLKFEVSKEITLSTSVNAPTKLVSHRGFIQQILTNLIKNAGHALMDTPEKPDKEIKVSIQEDSQKVVISVQDNGPGIPEDAKSRIFDPFFTTKDVGKGTGLGLSVSYNLAKKMGGQLQLNTENKDLTEFQLVFPVTP